MPDVDDMALLREYVDYNSEPAFAEIVRRRVNLVYSVALRFTSNSEDAQDVTQAVFVILARKSAGLRPNTIFTGWLYETTRFTAMNFLTRKNRRQAREQEAYMQSTANDPDAETVWRQLAPLLENAMSRLNEKDRTLVALRFFENRSITETAATLGVNQSAVRKRAERVIEKLRAYFSKRGIHSSAEAIVGAISAHSIQTAPALLAKTVTAAGIAKGATASTSTLTLIKGALKVMAWTKVKTAIVTGVAVVLAVGTVVITIKESGKQQSVNAQNTNPTLVNIRAQFVEAPERLAEGLVQEFFSSTNRTNTWSVIISEPQARDLLAKLRQNGVITVGALEVTTLSGRQARVEIPRVQSVIAGIKIEALTTPGIQPVDDEGESVFYATTNLSFGPVLDVIPSVEMKDHAINLGIIATVNEFLGYDQPGPTDVVTVYANNVPKLIMKPLPKIQTRKMLGRFNVRTGDSILFGNPLDSGGHPTEIPGVTISRLFVLVTPTIVDAAGNPRWH